MTFASVTASAMGSNYDIWRMSPNGADRQRLTSPSRHDTDPTYSPNGKSIAFLKGTRGTIYQ